MMMSERIENEPEIYAYLVELLDEDMELSMQNSAKIIEGLFGIDRYDAIRIVGRFMRERSAARIDMENSE